MRIIATSLLGFMAFLYTVSRLFEHKIPLMRFLTAFSEAGMVGGVADWFAIVALFKHPLGIPIWHTAIITKQKREISKTLAHFVVENFLTRKVIGKKLEEYDFSTSAGSLLIGHTDLISSKVVDIIPSLFGLLNDKDIHNLLHEQISSRLENIQLAPLAGEVLDMLTSHDKHHELFNEVIHAVQKIAGENRAFITSKVKSGIPFPKWGILDKVKDNLAEWLSGIIAAKISETTNDLENNSSHELRKSFENQIKKLIEDLKSSPELAARGKAILHTVLEHPAIRDYIVGLWSDIKILILRDVGNPDSAMKKQLASLVTGFATRILKEEPFRSRINEWLKEKVLIWIEKYKGEVSTTIIRTVENWKDEEIVRKLELSVGKDLQYIRLNGTIVGGLAGLTIYSIYQCILLCNTLLAK
jgi:uncharacterized membrane-anchored protein YjiN (DUF445 family)